MLTFSYAIIWILSQCFSTSANNPCNLLIKELIDKSQRKHENDQDPACWQPWRRKGIHRTAAAGDNDGDDGNAEMASNRDQSHLKEKTFQDGDSENNLTQLVLKFIETIGFFLIVRMPLILKFIVIIPSDIIFVKNITRPQFWASNIYTKTQISGMIPKYDEWGGWWGFGTARIAEISVFFLKSLLYHVW